MAFCSRCGFNLPDNISYCPQCGIRFQNTSPPQDQQLSPGYGPDPQYGQNVPYNQQRYPVMPPYPFYQGYGPFGSRKLKGGMLAWSIVLMVTGYGFVFGLIALVMTVLAKDEVTAFEERKKLKTARILNIIGTVAVVLVLLIAMLTVLYLIAEEPYYEYESYLRVRLTTLC